MPLPRWQCHKVVQAAKILQITHIGGGVNLDLDSGDHIPQTLVWDRKHTPQVGGYYVVYDDGYASWSPAEAFESGYTLIPEGTPDA